MELRKINLNIDKSYEKQVKKLFEQSFPKEERVPWWILRLNTRRAGFDLWAWLDGDTFCGFTLETTVGDLHFLMLLAVESAMHSKGYGSGILSVIRQEHETIVLNMEPMDETAPNYPERCRRLAFYKKNGFFDTGCDVWEVGGKFRILSTKPRLDLEAYGKIFKWLSFGLWNVKLKQEEKES